jgi:transcriptional regulator with XRE-family HTH domain
MNIDLSQTIREARGKRGISQQKLAEESGTSQTAVSFAETGSRPVSRNALTKILTFLDMNPGNLPETETRTQEQTGQRRPNRAERRRAERTASGPRPGGATRKLSRREEMAQLERHLARTLLIWSKISEVRDLGDGNWHIPEGTKTPEEIQREAARSGNFDQYSIKKNGENGEIIELREGLVILNVEKPGPGRLRVELVPETTRQTDPTWSFESERERDTEVKHLPVRNTADGDARVLDEKTQSLIPGFYRVRAEADTPWRLTWTQPAQGAGWLDLIEEEPRGNPGWGDPGLYIGGPTAPNWTRVRVRAVQETPAHLDVSAHPVDGSEPVVVLSRNVGPETLTLETDLDPDGEYMIEILARAKWDVWFVPAGEPGRTEGQRQNRETRRRRDQNANVPKGGSVLENRPAGEADGEAHKGSIRVHPDGTPGMGADNDRGGGDAEGPGQGTGATGVQLHTGQRAGHQQADHHQAPGEHRKVH